MFDGKAVENVNLPFRLYLKSLSSEEISPTYKSINTIYSVKYTLVGLIDCDQENIKINIHEIVIDR